MSHNPPPVPLRATEAPLPVGRGPTVEIDSLFRELGRLQRLPECADLLQYRSIVTAHQYLRLIEIFRASVVSGAEVLDWGCGNGHFSFLMERMGYHVTGFSFEDFGLRRYLSDRYVFAKGSPDMPVRLPFDDETFDAVASVGVLEHVRETGGTEAGSLAEIQRVLRPGGKFVCYHLPNRYSWIEMVNKVVPGKHRHRYRYTPGSIRRLCEGAGLVCRMIRRYGALPRNVWGRAPASLRDSAAVARVWDAVDSALGLPLAPFCQNFVFVAEKPGPR